MERDLILDIEVDRLTPKQAAVRLSVFLDDPRPHLAVTANPEILLRAHRDSAYRKLIGSADLVLADGFGLIIASWLTGHPLPGRTAGADIIHQLLEIAEKKSLEVYFAVNSGGLVRFKEVSQATRRHHLKLIVRGRDLWAGEEASDQTAVIIVANFGAPDQERWLRRNQSSFPKARLLIGVGGALDYLAGRVPRAPLPLRRLGLEWLWRLVLQPWRLPRILRATIIFPIVFLTHRPHGN